jgi:hypothetical protein
MSVHIDMSDRHKASPPRRPNQPSSIWLARRRLVALAMPETVGFPLPEKDLL